MPCLVHLSLPRLRPPSSPLHRIPLLRVSPPAPAAVLLPRALTMCPHLSRNLWSPILAMGAGIPCSQGKQKVRAAFLSTCCVSRVPALHW